MITPRQADKLIKSGKPIRVLGRLDGDQAYELTFVGRDRWHVYTQDGGKYDRTDLTVMP